MHKLVRNIGVQIKDVRIRIEAVCRSTYQGFLVSEQSLATSQVYISFIMKLQKTRFNAINNDPFFHFLIEDICTMRKKRSYKELINCITTYNFYFYM